jgi:molybdopterin/thiamine biosynthesis adenylyltransferase
VTDLWFLEDRARLGSERAAIGELATSAHWLIGTSWTFEDGLLCIDAVIRAHSHEYHVRMEYPRYFPSTPPTVWPTNAEFRWSTHQYGDINGPLCLEWGPDNWQPEMTGAHMLESAYRLFHTENPLGQGSPERGNPALSRHHLTLGQELRPKSIRFYISHQLLDYLASLPDKATGVVKFSNHPHAETYIALIHCLEILGGSETQVDDTIPNSLYGPEGSDSLGIGVYFKTTLEPDALSGIKHAYHLRSALWQLGHPASIFSGEDDQNPFGLTSRPSGALVLDRDNAPHFFFLLPDHKVIKATAVTSTAASKQRRLPQSLEALAGKSVGIVGLGSAGSKIALALARMGVRSFYLIDYDVFLPENIERHTLNWSSVGEHKVDGVREQLSRISANVDLNVSKIHLTGQESAAVVSKELQQLSRCDILIDATANPNVFNLLSAVTTAAHKPLVWLEVFAGGTGGLVARSRPDYDPPPQFMRQAYNRFCEDHPTPEGELNADYISEDAEGHVLVGSDADVGVIANYAAQLVVDTVLSRNPSSYPYSMYLIGLIQWWVFTSPFHNIPIDTHHLPRQVGRLILSDEDDQEQLRFIRDLLRKQSDEASSAPSTS